MNCTFLSSAHCLNYINHLGKPGPPSWNQTTVAGHHIQGKAFVKNWGMDPNAKHGEGVERVKYLKKKNQKYNRGMEHERKTLDNNSKYKKTKTKGNPRRGQKALMRRHAEGGKAKLEGKQWTT